MFEKNGSDFFHKRPIDPIYLEYAAWDVRDLVQVRENMLLKLRKLGKKLGNLDNDILDTWVDYLSNEYIKNCFQEYREFIEIKLCNKNPQIFSNIKSALL